MLVGVAPHGAFLPTGRTIAMGFDDALNKAKDAAADNPAAVDKGIDTASEKVQERTGDATDEKVQGAADAASERFGSGGGEGN